MRNYINTQTIFDFEKLGLSAECFYKKHSPKTPYHNWNHALNVADCIKDMFKHDFGHETHYALLIAAYWHDAVYVPGNSDNEAKSASALWALICSINIYPLDPILTDICRKAFYYIKKTTVKDHLMSENISTPLGYLLDADLNSLGTPSFEVFVQNQDRIILENGGNFETDKYKCADFLKQFLTCREHIYHTEYGRTKWEANARYNIEKYVALYVKKDEPVNVDTLFNQKLSEIIERRVDEEMKKISIEDIITKVVEAHFNKFYGKE